MAGQWFIDAGWGDWRLIEDLQTRVTAEQVAAISALDDVKTMGASDVRFGEMTGEMVVFHNSGGVTSVLEDGAMVQEEAWR